MENVLCRVPDVTDDRRSPLVANSPARELVIWTRGELMFTK